jgi:hypothetical protein
MITLMDVGHRVSFFFRQRRVRQGGKCRTAKTLAVEWRNDLLKKIACLFYN